MNLKEMRYNWSMTDNAYTRRYLKDPPEKAWNSEEETKKRSQAQKESIIEDLYGINPVDNSVEDVEKPIFDIKPDDEMPAVTEIVVDELKGKDD